MSDPLLDLSRVFSSDRVLPEGWLLFSVHAGAYYESDGYRDTWRDHIVIDPDGNEVCRIHDRESLIDTDGKMVPPGCDYILTEEGLCWQTLSNEGRPVDGRFLLVTSSPGLQKAATLASRAFDEREDKGHQPYVYHLIRVMRKGRNESERIVGMLHDLVEDCDQAFIKEFRQDFPSEITDAVQCMTKKKGEDYERYLQRVKDHPVARNVKLYDLEDNMNLSRIKDPGEEDLQRLEKYKRAYERLKDR